MRPVAYSPWMSAGHAPSSGGDGRDDSLGALHHDCSCTSSCALTICQQLTRAYLKSRWLTGGPCRSATECPAMLPAERRPAASGPASAVRCEQPEQTVVDRL